MLCSLSESLGQFGSFTGFCFSRLWLWMMLIVMFWKSLLVLMNRRVTAGCILLMRRSFREQTPCSQFSRARSWGSSAHLPMVTGEHPLLQQLYVALLVLCISVCASLLYSLIHVCGQCLGVSQISPLFSRDSESLSELDFRHWLGP